MLHRFQQGTIVDLTAMETIFNTNIYVVDKTTGQIRSAHDVDEYLTHQVVLVNNVDHPLARIDAGQVCRCWYVYLVI